MADELMRDLPGDLPTFLARFGTDAQCRACLTHGRWPEGFCCAGCGHGRAYSHRVRLIEECAACGKQHSLLAGTMFEQTKTGLARWFLAIWLVTSSKGGISAVELQRQMGFGSYQTAWSWLHKIRKAMVRPSRRPLAARVEADETLVGGAKPGKRGRGAAGKTVVAGAVEAGRGKGRGRRLGRLRLQAVADASAEKVSKISSPATWHRPPQSPPTSWPGYAGLGRAGRLPPRGDQPRHRLGRRGAAPARDRSRSSASPSGGCSARTMARSAGNTSRPISTSTSSACMGLGVSDLECRHRVPSCVEFISVAAAQPRFGARRSEGSSPSGADHCATSLYPADRGDPGHDPAMRIGGEAPGRRAHSSTRHESHRKARVTATSDRHRQPAGEPWAGRGNRLGGPAAAEPAHAAGRRTTPSGVSPVVTKRHSAISSLRANATIMVLRVPPRASAVPSPVPDRQTAGLLEPEETPGELDHAAAHARVARLGEPLLPPPGAALLRRARQAGVAGHRPSVAQVAREDLVRQHVRRLDADADHACPAAEPSRAAVRRVPVAVVRGAPARSR